MFLNLETLQLACILRKIVSLPSLASSLDVGSSFQVKEKILEVQFESTGSSGSLPPKN